MGCQVDRKEDFYLNNGVYFPHQAGLDSVHSSTVLDGELVIDVDPGTQQVRSPWTRHPADIDGPLTWSCFLSRYVLA